MVGRGLLHDEPDLAVGREATLLIDGLRFGRAMFPVPVRYVPEPAVVLAWLAVALVVSAIACAWPAYRATRVATAAALAYE